MALEDDDEVEVDGAQEDDAPQDGRRDEARRQAPVEEER